MFSNMFFKRARFFTLLTMIFTLFVGCADEQRPYANPLVVKSSKDSPIQCLREAPETMKSFVRGRLLHHEVDEFWDCTSAAVKMFKRWVRGKHPGRYSGKEVRHFLQENFLGDIRISDPLLVELMELKRLFLGGSAEHLLFTELDDTLGFFEEFRELTLKLHPHMKVYLTDWRSKDGGPKPTETEFAEAIDVLKQAADQIGVLLTRHNIDYSFAHLSNLVEHSSGVFLEGFSEEEDRDAQNLLLVVQRLKSLLVGPDITQIRGSEWPRFLFVVADAFSWGLRYYGYLKGGEWNIEPGLSHVDTLFASILDSLEYGMGLRENPRFTGDEIKTLLREVNEVFPLTGTFDLTTLSLAWDVVAGKILSALQKDKADTDLTLPKVKALRSEFDRWKSTQEFVLKIASTKLAPRFPQHEQKFAHASGPVRPIKSRLEEEEPSGVDELLRVLDGAPWPLANDDKDRVWIRRDGVIVHSVDSLTLLNIEKTFVRLLIKSYAHDPSRKLKVIGLNEAELKEAYFDLKPFAVSFGLVKEDNNNFHKRLLLEGNLFLPRSDGNSMVSFEEGVEYLHYVLAGYNAANYMLSDIETGVGPLLFAGPGTDSLCEIFSDPEYSVDVECYRARMIGHFKDYFSHMPLMVDFVQGLSPSGWRVFESALERTVRDEGYSPLPITKTDIVEMCILLQYIETLVLRFDAPNKDYPYDEKIDVHEALNGVFPIFSESLNRLLPFLGPQDVLPFFTYMLKYGAPPDPSLDPMHELRFRHWKFLPDSWEFYADRSTIANILAELNTASPTGN